MADSRQPVRPIMAPGAPPPGAPHTLWSERAAHMGAHSPGPSALDRCCGFVFLLLYRMLGWALWLPLLLHPGARKHMIGLPAPQPGWTWLHGASAGEHTAARALAHCVEDCWRTSSSWRTPVQGAFPAPLDLPLVVGRWLDRARPGRVVLIEAELWPGWIAACRERGIPICVVNAAQGQGTARWRRFGPLWRWLTEGVHVVEQAQPGDLKLFTEVREATLALGREAIIAASTRPGDEARILKAWESLPAPRPLLLLAPRHLKRVDEVANLLDRTAHRWSRRTEGIDPASAVVLLDTLGELAALYPQATAAFIGGTFDAQIGGHSPAEALAAGLPVVHGPHIASNALAFTAGITLCAQTEEQLPGALRAALSVGPGVAPENESSIRVAAALPPIHIPPERLARPWLFPLVPLWRALSWLVRRTQAVPTRVSVPVVVVGGLAAGGAGRTPTAGFLAEQIPGAWVLGRGYRRDSRGPKLRVGLPDQTPEFDLGDELEMLRRRGIPVVSCRNRVAGAKRAIAEGARWLILDGGLEYPGLIPDLRIVCVDAQWPNSRGRIPVGQRRSNLSWLGRADVIWVNHARPPIPMPGLDTEVPVVRAWLEPDSWHFDAMDHPLSAVSGSVHAMAGIARPERFCCTLLRMGLDIDSWTPVGNHRSLGTLRPKVVITEKDAARLPQDAPVVVLKMTVKARGASAVLDRIRGLL